MKKNKVKIEVKDKLKEELGEFIGQVCVGAAAYVRNELTATTYEAFERFYCHYVPVLGSYPCSYSWKFSEPKGHPIEYVRTFNVLSNGIIQKFYENKHGKIIRGGVELHPENMKENYNIPAADVFGNISTGYHGLPSPYNDIPDMDPSPQEIVISKRKELCGNLDTLTDIGVDRAKKGNYSFLQI